MCSDKEGFQSLTADKQQKTKKQKTVGGHKKEFSTDCL